jgi:hypothetical protein
MFIFRETLNKWLRGRLAALRGARSLAYLLDMSRSLRSVRLALSPARRFLQRFLSGGCVGIACANIPNMRGTTGLVQKILNRRIYDIHVPLTPSQVKSAHEAAGLSVIEAGYFLSSNFGVMNLGDPNRKSPGGWAKKIALAILVRISMAVWWVERKFGKFPVSQAFSPYVNCVGIRPRNANL